MVKAAWGMEPSVWGDRKDDTRQQYLSWGLKAVCRAGELRNVDE